MLGTAHRVGNPSIELRGVGGMGHKSARHDNKDQNGCDSLHSSLQKISELKTAFHHAPRSASCSCPARFGTGLDEQRWKPSTRRQTQSASLYVFQHHLVTRSCGGKTVHQF